MHLEPLTTGDLIDLSSVLLNFVAVATGIVVLLLTKKSVDALTQQLRSQSQHTIMEAHKSLFIEIVKDPQLLQVVAPENADAFRANMLASMLINHCARIFKDFEERLASHDDFDNFIDDARDMFAIRAVAERWPAVKAFHATTFQQFIEETVLRTKAPDVAEASVEAASAAPLLDTQATVAVATVQTPSASVATAS